MADELGNALIDSAISDTLKDLSSDALEYGLDAVTDNEAIKAIPVFGVLLKVWKGFSSYRDYQFMKVISRFLYAFKTVTENERTEVLIKLQDDPEYKSKVGEKLMFILNKVDDINKADIHGNLFAAYSMEKFSLDILSRLCAIVNNCFFPDMVAYGDKQVNSGYKVYDEQQLANAGFLSTSVTQTGMTPAQRRRINGFRDENSLKIEANDLQKPAIKMTLNSYGAMILWFGMNIRKRKVWLSSIDLQRSENAPAI